jgi:hypothetical protein
VAARSKAQGCGRSHAEIVGSNATGAWMPVVCVVYCQVSATNHSSRGVLRTVVRRRM